MVTRRSPGKWVRLDVGFHAHPKALGVGAAGRDGFLASVCWSARYGTDGRIPPLAWQALASGLGQDPDGLAELLTQARLLDAHGDTLVVHDFHDWQETAEEVAALRAAARERAAARAAAQKNGGAEHAPNKRRTNSKRTA